MTEQRFTDMEMRLAFLEHSVQTLDQVIQDLGETLDRTRRELVDLKDTMNTYAHDGKENLSSTERLLNEKPPHY